MTHEQIKIELTNEMENASYEPEMIEKLTNDIDVIKWVEYCLTTMSDEYRNINDLINDPGFDEFLECQFLDPITFDEMI